LSTEERTAEITDLTGEAVLGFCALVAWLIEVQGTGKKIRWTNVSLSFAADQ
jgi:hypothetical protein